MNTFKQITYENSISKLDYSGVAEFEAVIKIIRDGFPGLFPLDIDCDDFEKIAIFKDYLKSANTAEIKLSYKTISAIRAFEQHLEIFGKLA